VAAEKQRLTGRVAQSTSWRTFDNALRRLQPRTQSIGSGFIPAVGNRRQSALFAFALEAEPALAELGRHFDGPAKRVPASLRRVTAVSETLGVVDAAAGRRPTVRFASFSRRRRNQPNLPPSASRVEKGPITHTISPVAGLRLIRADDGTVLQGWCQKSTIRRLQHHILCAQTCVYRRGSYRASSFLPVSRRSKLRSALNTRK
jgi:hypothetical protein